MGATQKPLSSRREAFSQLMAGGNISAAEAYSKVYPKASKASAETMGPRLLRSPAVKARVAELQGKAAEGVVRKIEEVAKFCEDVIFTPLAGLDENSPLVQEVHYEQMRGKGSENRETVKIKLPSKLDAIDKLAKLRGWYAVEKIQVDAGDPLLAVLARARQRK